MKSLILTILLICAKCLAGQTTLTWDQVTGATNYILVARTNALNNTNALSSPIKLSTGTNIVVTIYDLAPTSKYNFGVMAQNAAGVSDLSNILPIQVPAPTTARVMQVQYAIIGTNGIGQFTDAYGAVYRLVIGP